MILVRDVFRLHFGKGRQAIALAKEGMQLEQRLGYPASRVLTDLRSPSALRRIKKCRSLASSG